MGNIEKAPSYAAREEPPESVVVRVASRIADVPASDWDACARGTEAPLLGAPRPINPFISHDFLLALEESGSVTQETGWLPQHLLLEDSSGALIGCMPCYLKSHSQGEYVFDHGWAGAYLRAGGRYYPKLQASIPFTPVTGKRLLVPAGADRSEREALVKSLRRVPTATTRSASRAKVLAAALPVTPTPPTFSG